ncbi:hypothetical protein D9M69_420030 [compost metagenome]
MICFECGQPILVTEPQTPVARIIYPLLILLLEPPFIQMHKPLNRHREGGLIKSLCRIDTPKIKTRKVLFQPITVAVHPPLDLPQETVWNELGTLLVCPNDLHPNM